jgi:Flp pilus assembly protein TadB
MTLALAIAGTLIALGGLAFTALEWRARRRAVDAERQDRVEEIELVRRQVEASERQAELGEDAHEAARRADVRIRGGGRGGLGWSFNVVNIGPAPATAIKAWLIRTDAGQPLNSATVGIPAPSLPGEESRGRGLVLPISEEVIRNPPPLAVMISWVDTRQRERRDDYPVDL